MRNADILVKMKPILEKMNLKQRSIATQIMLSSDYSFLEYKGEICIKTKEGELFNFLAFVKSKCNCN
jgi:hypothetical protein